MKFNPPVIPQMPPTLSEVRRLLSKVEYNTVTGCWMWKGRKDARGYGKFHYRGRQLSAHRVAFTIFGGDLIDDYTVNHKCRRTDCINPWHLEAMLHSENVADGNRNRRRTSDVPF